MTRFVTRLAHGAFTSAVLLLVGAVTVATYTQRPRAPYVEPVPRWRQRTTQILERMTPAERTRALYFQDRRTGIKLLDRQVSLGDRTYLIEPEPSPAEIVFDRIACGSAATFVGTVLDARTHPIADGTFLFTDYVLRLDEAIRMPGRSFVAGDEIILSRPGGALTVDGILTTASTDLFRALTKGVQYVLFASYIPSTRSFISRLPSGTFSLVGNEVLPHRDLPISDRLVEFRKIQRDEFLMYLRTTWGHCHGLESR